VSWYVPAIVLAAADLVALIALTARAVTLSRRFRVLAGAYRRHLAAESALLEHRRAELLAELARRRGRT
jgi:hypothetical protein